MHPAEKVQGDRKFLQTHVPQRRKKPRPLAQAGVSSRVQILWVHIA